MSDNENKEQNKIVVERKVGPLVNGRKNKLPRVGQGNKRKDKQ